MLALSILLNVLTAEEKDTVESHDRPIREGKRQTEEDCLIEPEYKIYNKNVKITIYKVF